VTRMTLEDAGLGMLVPALSGILFLTVFAATLLFASGRFWVFHGSD
jgi:hypothetical protein